MSGITVDSQSIEDLFRWVDTVNEMKILDTSLMYRDLESLVKASFSSQDEAVQCIAAMGNGWNAKMASVGLADKTLAHIIGSIASRLLPGRGEALALEHQASLLCASPSALRGLAASAEAANAGGCPSAPALEQEKKFFSETPSSLSNQENGFDVSFAAAAASPAPVSHSLIATDTNLDDKNFLIGNLENIPPSNSSGCLGIQPMLPPTTCRCTRAPLQELPVLSPLKLEIQKTQELFQRLLKTLGSAVDYELSVIQLTNTESYLRSLQKLLEKRQKTSSHPV